MDFHGYDTGDPNKWYQSRSDLREPAAGYGFYDEHYNSYFIEPFNQHPPFPTHPHTFPPPQNNHSETIINGYTFPHQFPFASQAHTQMSPVTSLTYSNYSSHALAEYPNWSSSQIGQPATQLVYPVLQPGTNYFIPTKATTTPSIYQSGHLSQFIPNHEPKPQFSDPKPPTPSLSVVDYEPSLVSLGDLGHPLEVQIAATGAMDHSSSALLVDPAHNFADITAVDIIVDGEIELQSTGHMTQNLKMSFSTIEDDEFSSQSDKLRPVQAVSPLENRFDETCKGDARIGTTISKNSDERIQSKGGGAIVDCQLVLDYDYSSQEIENCVIKVYDSGQENLVAGDRFKNLKVDSHLGLAKIWVRWKSEVSAGNTVEVGDKELNVEALIKSMDFLENLMGCNIDLANDNDYSSSCYILVSQNLFQVTILNSKSKAALSGLQFIMSSVTLESLILEFDKSGSMFMDHVIMALVDALLECNHWIVEWAKDKPGWQELLKYDSEFNQHVLVRNVIAHAQLNVETLLDEMGHTRVLGLHVFFDEVHVIFLDLDLGIKCAIPHRLSNNLFYLVLRYAITSIPKCSAFFKDCVTGKGTILEVLTILLSDLELVEIQNHKFSSSESRIIQYIMGISISMKFEDYIATTIQEVTSLRLLTVHLVLMLFALLKSHLGVKLESARHNSLVLKFLKVMILYCSYILYEIQACVWLELLQLVGFFFNGDTHWNVLQRFMEFKLMILGNDTTSELAVWQDAVVKNHQQYLGKLNARYVALLTLREVISVEEFGQTVRFGMSSEEIIDFPNIISESYALWVFEVDKEVVLATFGVIQVMYLLPLEHQKELRKQVVAKKEVSDFQSLLQVHYLLQGYPHIG